jgi:hypothetical protein
MAELEQAPTTTSDCCSTAAKAGVENVDWLRNAGRTQMSQALF